MTYGCDVSVEVVVTYDCHGCDDVYGCDVAVKVVVTCMVVTIIR